jgi:hypothetical protein
MTTNVKLFALGPLTAAALTTLATIAGPVTAHADPNLPYGPDTCVQGLVWREAREGDTVCVRPEDRDRTAWENATAAERRDPNGGPYGPNTCKQGFVWREAFDGDAVCVTPDTRRENLDWNRYDRGTVLGAERHKLYPLPYPPPPNDLG